MDEAMDALLRLLARAIVQRRLRDRRNECRGRAHQPETGQPQRAYVPARPAPAKRRAGGKHRQR